MMLRWTQRFAWLTLFVALVLLPARMGAAPSPVQASAGAGGTGADVPPEVVGPVAPAAPFMGLSPTAAIVAFSAGATLLLTRRRA